MPTLNPATASPPPPPPPHTLLHAAWLRALFSQPEKPEYAKRILEEHLLVDSPLTAALVGG